jgi:hypothetical protein
VAAQVDGDVRQASQNNPPYYNLKQYRVNYLNPIAIEERRKRPSRVWDQRLLILDAPLCPLPNVFICLRPEIFPCSKSEWKILL